MHLWLLLLALAGLSNPLSHPPPTTRRAALTAATLPFLLRPLPSPAEALPPLPKVSSKLYLDVRIARSDGTFFTKPAASAPDPDPVFTGRLVLGVFGDVSPVCSAKFASFVAPPSSDLPSYASSTFPAVTLSPSGQSSLISAGAVNGLSLTSVLGGSALSFGETLLPANLWLEDRAASPPLPVDRPGLLLHRNLDALPAFQISTGADGGLAGGYTVFGTVLEGRDVLDRILEVGR